MARAIFAIVPILMNMCDGNGPTNACYERCDLCECRDFVRFLVLVFGAAQGLCKSGCQGELDCRDLKSARDVA
jgi:hypothetical protein